MLEWVVIALAEFFYDVLVPLGLALMAVLTPWVLLTWGYRVIHTSCAGRGPN